ncbi:hypothetical protein OAH18_00995 [bacterium]|nr:hypothetical protein [bacterium]
MMNRIAVALTLLTTSSATLVAQVQSPSQFGPATVPPQSQMSPYNGDGSILPPQNSGVKTFPSHWGAPPKYQTFDLVPLPGGYGTGSSTMRAWIQKNLDADAAAAKGQPGNSKYPAHWPPLTGPRTTDYVPLPGGYGFGSSTEAAWIRRNMAADATRDARDTQPLPQPGQGQPPAASRYPIHWGLPPIYQSRDLVQLPGGYGQGNSTLAAWIQRNLTADINQNPNGHQPGNQPQSKPFPAHWPSLTGPVATDRVQWPGGYGYGSSSVGEWIRKNMAADAAHSGSGHQQPYPNNGAQPVAYPSHWGAPPQLQTRDLVQLPGGYGYGSSTLKNWIQLNLNRDRSRSPVIRGTSIPAKPTPSKPQIGQPAYFGPLKVK